MQPKNAKTNCNSVTVQFQFVVRKHNYMCLCVSSFFQIAEIESKINNFWFTTMNNQLKMFVHFVYA